MTSPNFDHIPERRENWAEAEFKGKAKSVITVRDDHVLISDEPAGFVGGFGGGNAGPTPTGYLATAFAADIPAMLNRIARELGFEIASLRARVQFAWNPRGIAGAEGIAPTPFEAISDIWIKSSADAATIEKMKWLTSGAALYTISSRKLAARWLRIGTSNQWIIDN